MWAHGKPITVTRLALLQAFRKNASLKIPHLIPPVRFRFQPLGHPFHPHLGRLGFVPC